MQKKKQTKKLEAFTRERRTVNFGKTCNYFINFLNQNFRLRSFHKKRVSFCDRLICVF